MNCGFFQRWLMASADGELAGWRAAWLRSHTAGCAACAKHLAELRQLRDLVASRKTDYAFHQDSQLFWQKLRAHLQSEPQPGNDAELVLAYSQRTVTHTPESEPEGVALFGRFTTRQLAFAAVGVAVAAAVLIGVLLPKGGGDQVAELPLLAPPGAGSVSFSNIKSTADTSADPVKFDKPDVDIHVIWVSGLPYLEKEKTSGPPGG
jgi:anti-sigma factor RsiW